MDTYTYYCDTCNKKYTRTGLYKHKNSKLHKKRFEERMSKNPNDNKAIIEKLKDDARNLIKNIKSLERTELEKSEFQVENPEIQVENHEISDNSQIGNPTNFIEIPVF